MVGGEFSSSGRVVVESASSAVGGNAVVCFRVPAWTKGAACSGGGGGEKVSWRKL